MEWYWIVLIILGTIGLTVFACALWFSWWLSKDGGIWR